MATSHEQFKTYISTNLKLAKTTFTMNAPNATPEQYQEYVEKFEKELLEVITRGFMNIQIFLNTLKLLLNSQRFKEHELYKKIKVNDLKYFSIKSKNSIEPKKILSFKWSIILCSILLFIPFLSLLYFNKPSLIIDISQNVLKMVIPSTLGMLALVITSATFIVNFYKDSDVYKLNNNWDKMEKDVKEQINPEEIYKVSDKFLFENEKVILDSSNGQNISNSLKKLANYLLLFVLFAVFSLLISSLPFEFNIWLFLFLLICLLVLFFNILFTILLVIRIITNKLLFNKIEERKPTL